MYVDERIIYVDDCSVLTTTYISIMIYARSYYRLNSMGIKPIICRGKISINTQAGWLAMKTSSILAGRVDPLSR